MPVDQDMGKIIVAIQDPFFIECLISAASNKELVNEFDRLTGFDLSLKGPAINRAVDMATGYLDAGLREFIKFVYDCVYLRCSRGG